MATKRFTAGAWRFRVTRKILPKPVYRTFDSEEEGDKWCRRLEELLDRGIIPDGLFDHDAKLLPQIIREYLQTTHVKSDDTSILKLIEESYSSLRIGDLTYGWVESWVSKQKREDHRAPGTIRHYVGALARCLDWALAKEYLTTNPLRQLPRGYAQYTAEDEKYVERREDREMDRRLEEGEEELIRAAIPDEAMGLLFELALETGMRLSEIYPISWDQVDLNGRTIFLEKTKNGHKRQVPLSSVAIKALKGYPVQEGDLFPWGGKDKRTSARLSKRWARLFDAAGATGFRFHCLRHEATSRFFERTDLHPLEIAKITGHSGERVLMRYANLRASTLAEKLW